MSMMNRHVLVLGLSLLVLAAAAKAGTDQEPGTFLEYCESEGKSADEEYTIKALAKKYGTKTCEELDNVARTYVTLNLYAMDLVDVRAFNYFTEIHSLVVTSRKNIRAEQLKPSDKLKTVYLYAPMDDLPYMGPNVEKLRLHKATGVNIHNLGRYKKLKEFGFTASHADSSFDGLRHLTQLEVLGIAHSNFSDVTHLPAAPNLHYIVLSHNKIASLEGFPELPGLKAMHLDNNLIRRIAPLTVLTGIEGLDIDDNPIIDMESVLKLPSLKSLRANRTGVKDWQFIARMPNLEELAIAGNVLDDDDLDRLVNEHTPLLKLDISDNFITDLAPLYRLDQIASVNASGNLLRSLEKLPDTLWWFWADHNQITDLRRYHAPALRYLSLQHNGLRDLTGLGHNTHLKKLDLSHNLIDDLMPMRNFCCEPYLLLRKNPIKTTVEKTPANCPLDAKSKEIRQFCKY